MYMRSMFVFLLGLCSGSTLNGFFGVLKEPIKNMKNSLKFRHTTTTKAPESSDSEDTDEIVIFFEKSYMHTSHNLRDRPQPKEE